MNTVDIKHLIGLHTLTLHMHSMYSHRLLFSNNLTIILGLKRNITNHVGFVNCYNSNNMKKHSNKHISLSFISHSCSLLLSFSSSSHQLLLWRARHCRRCNHHSCGGPLITWGLHCDLDKLRWDVFASPTVENTGWDTWSWIRTKERGPERGREISSLSVKDGGCDVFLNSCGCCCWEVMQMWRAL